jgi:hypothetical protein
MSSYISFILKSCAITRAVLASTSSLALTSLSSHAAPLKPAYYCGIERSRLPVSLHSKRSEHVEWCDPKHYVSNTHITLTFSSLCLSSITFNECWLGLQRSRETDTRTSYRIQQTIAYLGEFQSTLQSLSYLTDYVSVAIRSKCQCRKHPHPPLPYTLILEIKHVTCSYMYDFALLSYLPIRGRSA